MLLLTRSGAVIADEHLKPQGLLKDDDYKTLAQDPEVCVSFLQALGVDSFIVDRLGNEIEVDRRFERKDFSLDLPNVPVVKEMGYYHRL